MHLKGNKGEWSEIYTLLKLLGDGEVYAGDEKMNKISDLFFPIIMILRVEQGSLFKYINSARNIIIEKEDGTRLLQLSAYDFLSEAIKLLTQIKKGKGAFELPQTEEFLRKINCSSLKASSRDKVDIRVVLHDRRTNMDSEMGFSIKSQIGGRSTLLNASSATNVSYKIAGTHLSDSDILEINSIDTKNKIKDRFDSIKRRGGILIFDNIDSNTFLNNLKMLDYCLPQIVASLLQIRLEHGENDMKELLKLITKENPLNFEQSCAFSFYEYKIKHLLTAVALGMMPSIKWGGQFAANGGYLVVKEDGEILCYRFYDRNRFEDYLLSNTYIDSPSTERHGYGKIIKQENGTIIFKLNIQIRFK
ncbi:MAG: HpaII family restriction endonuclease [Opitutae bacterium]|nr:HpaII family restriction endonuclease [Opitutae bacterium]